jgi:CRISPR-associated protein Cmr2
MRDYLTYEIQKNLSSIDELQKLEQVVDANKRQDKKEAEEVAKQKRQAIIKRSHSPSTVYQFLAATKEADPTAFRTEWQNTNKNVQYPRDAVIEYYQKNSESPEIDLALLPTGSFALQFTFTLAQPYISRDEQDFYIIDNPIRKDKILGLPYVASTSWKGSLRAALWQLGSRAQDEAICRLFGNEKGEENQDKLHAGRLYFFSTFFTQKSLEIINPHDRERRVGKNPILFESVPGGVKGTTGNFTLLYVPFDRIGKGEKKTREQVAQDLQLVAEGVQAMFRIYGFGAKTSSGFGHANEPVANGLLRLRVKVDEVQKAEAMTPISQPLPPLPRHLETPDRLKPEYLTIEGTFRERTEAELKKTSKADRQVYDKAKSWWQRESQQLVEAVAKQPNPIEQTKQETQQPAMTVVWPEYSFKDFAQLVACANERAEALCNGGGM